MTHENVAAVETFPTVYQAVIVSRLVIGGPDGLAVDFFCHAVFSQNCADCVIRQTDAPGDGADAFACAAL